MTTGYPLLDRIAPISHDGFYVLVLLMVGGGFTTAILAGLPAIVLGGSGAPLPPTFKIYPSFLAHGYIATILAGFIVLHVLAAFYHQFVRRDRLFARMFYGHRASRPQNDFAAEIASRMIVWLGKLSPSRYCFDLRSKSPWCSAI